MGRGMSGGKTMQQFIDTEGFLRLCFAESIDC